jgi:zinc protease
MGALLPTEEPFLYTISATATEGTSLARVEEVVLEEIDRVRRAAVTDAELAKAKQQLKTRLVFDNDSITNIAHQLGYYETIASVDVFLSLQDRIAAVTADAVALAAQAIFEPSNRTIGWFDPPT